ncbi:hypothetical protein PYCC9005_001987 [Savitreella phatthalungensis]
MAVRPITPGIYTPTLTFFNQDETVSLEQVTKHAVFLAQSGVKGLVLQGSTGEAFSLTREERKEIVAAVRQALDNADQKSCLIIAGIGGQSLRESLAYARDAADAGADYGIALSPSFFINQMTPQVLERYFTQLADNSPLPFLIYNFPGVTNGIDLQAPLLAKLAQHPKIVGTKLTCNTISKIQYLNPAAGAVPQGWAVFSGSSQFLPAGHAAGFTGAITGLSNMFPKTLVHLWKLIEADEKTHRSEIARLQQLVAKYELIMMRDFIPGNKATLQLLGRYGGPSRSPLVDATPEQIAIYKQAIGDIRAFEDSL